MRKMGKKGFTLVELVIVMVILGTLAAIAVPKMGNSKDGAVYSSMKSDARLAIAEAQSYYSETLEYTDFDCSTLSYSKNNTCASSSTEDTFKITISNDGVCTNTIVYDSESSGGITGSAGDICNPE